MSCFRRRAIRTLTTNAPVGGLTYDTLNSNLRNAQYAVRGELVLKAMDYAKALQTKEANLPFDKLVYCNIGNPQELGQKPISFFRQVSALVIVPIYLMMQN